jgi:hypothetical protein
MTKGTADGLKKRATSCEEERGPRRSGSGGGRRGEEVEEEAVTAGKERGDRGSVRVATDSGVWAAKDGGIVVCCGLGDGKKQKSQFIPMWIGKAPY